MNLPEIPEDQKATPRLQSFIQLFVEQARIIQTLSEENAKLKITVQELRDELARVKKTPPAPKFRQQKNPDKGEKSGNSKSSNTNRNACKPKIKEEVILRPPNLPERSRLKGFSTYKIQELVVTAKDIIYRWRLGKHQMAQSSEQSFQPE